jgi:hypothetical protein
MTTYDETRLAQLLRALPPPPQGWVEAAQELPRGRLELDEVVARAEADVEFRRAMLADMESALVTAGYTPTPALVARVRERLART